MQTLRYLILCLALVFGTLAQANPIDDILKRAGSVNTTQVIGDEAFAKRAYLNIVGRIPTAQESNEFTNAKTPNKRGALVDNLVGSAGYTSHWSNFWMDMLRGRDRLNNVNYFSGEPYIDYIEGAIASNKPYDKLIAELLTSTGNYVENPATGYFLADLGMPLDNFIGTVKRFAGLDIGCAQCHDDPFQDWSQKQFYEGAAYFAQIQLRSRDKETRDKMKEVFEDIKENKGDPMANQVRQFLSASISDVKFEAGKKLTLPKDYKYDDGKPNEAVEPAPLFGAVPQASTDRREEFVGWLQNTDYFERNIANRLWGYIMGEPISPISNLQLEKNPARVKLLNELGARFKALKYDIRAFATEIYNSEFFQREAYKGDKNKYAFQGPVYRRLSAEQIWDSVVTLAVGNVDYFSNSFTDSYRQFMHIDFTTLTTDEALARQDQYRVAKQEQYKTATKKNGLLLIRASEVLDFNSPSARLLKQFGRSDRELINASSREGSSTQVMAFMNGPLVDIVVDKDSYFERELKKLSDARAATDFAFVSIVGRRPSLIEREYFAKYTPEDLTWALLNSIEFKFN